MCRFRCPGGLRNKEENDMGYGSYSHEAHASLVQGRAQLSTQQIFSQTRLHPSMNPFGVKVRESRDTNENANSLGIVFALDVSGSMGQIPALLATKELPSFMSALAKCDVRSPQVLFMAFTDHECDGRPLQVGQFETTGELMDQWLVRCSLSGGGEPAPAYASTSGRYFESYDLALYFASKHTSMDCWEKRKKKGYLFMTGDEPPYSHVRGDVVKHVIGDDTKDTPLADVIAKLKETFEPFFLIPDAARAERIRDAWRALLGDRVIVLEGPQDTTGVAAGVVALGEGTIKDAAGLSAKVGERAARCLAPWRASSRA
jgi:hypothetical protein